MDKKKKLLSLKEKDIQSKATNKMFDEIPNIGIKGAIHNIEEANECYYIIEYNADGTLDPIKKPVPKNKGKNLPFITDIYYKNLKKYLEINNDKYLKYKNIPRQHKLSKMKLKVYTIITFVATSCSLPVLFFVSDIGAVFSAISLLSLYKVYDLKKTQDNQEKFIKRYDVYQRMLIEYNLKNEQPKKKYETKYTKIATKEEPVQEKTRPKTLSLTKEEKREAA